MGSLRNPVGPLPSSIYWRRRVVAFAAVGLIAALVIWAVTSGGGGSGKSASAPTGSRTPAGTITPGPEPTGTHITGRPGGRDTAPTDGGSTGSDGDAGDGTSAGADAGASAGVAAGDTEGTTAGASAGASAGGGAAGGTVSDGDRVPVGSTLPTCSPGTVSLALTSVQNSYAPGEKPVFQLRATNSGAVTCKLDFGPRSAVFTVTKTPDDSHVWASDDCPAAGSPDLRQVPAHGTATFSLPWNGKTSSPQCARPKGAQAAPGNYLAQAQLSGFGTKSVPFVLSQD